MMNFRTVKERIYEEFLINRDYVVAGFSLRQNHSNFIILRTLKGAATIFHRFLNSNTEIFVEQGSRNPPKAD